MPFRKSGIDRARNNSLHRASQTNHPENWREKTWQKRDNPLNS